MSGRDKDKEKDKKDDQKEDKKKRSDNKDKDKDKKGGGGGGGKKSKAKVAFEVVVKGLDQLKPDDNGKKIQVTWRRGRKSSNRGKTKPVNTQNPYLFIYLCIITAEYP